MRNQESIRKFSVHMGGGGTFVDGVLRWFQRRHNNEDAILTDLQKPHNTHLQERAEDNNQEFTITEDFDITGLKLIKVPKRLSFPISAHSSMDPLKKVSFLFSLFVLLPTESWTPFLFSFGFYCFTRILLTV